MSMIKRVSKILLAYLDSKFSKNEYKNIASKIR